MKMKNALLASAVIAGLASFSTSQATTLMRASLDELVKANHSIISGEVVDLYSYWNKDHSFIFTDVTVAVTDSLQGRFVNGNQVTFTLMGGTVDDLTTMIVAGPSVDLGENYVFFLNNDDLPGASAMLTIPELSQGIFNLKEKDDVVHVVSQANEHPLYPDKRGVTEAAGGSEGYRYSDFKREVSEISVNVRGLNRSTAK